MLSTRIRVQLNTLVFDKTLKRKDVSGVSNVSEKDDSSDGKKNGDAASSSSGGPEEDEESAEKGFGSKTSILALFSIDVDRYVPSILVFLEMGVLMASSLSQCRRFRCLVLLSHRRADGTRYRNE